MLFELKLPLIVPQMSAALIECLYAQSGTALHAGAKLLDLSIDLGSAFTQDCPPISFFRIVLREPLWLRRLDAVVGQPVQIGAPMALFSSTESEALDQPPQRAVRTTIAGIVHHAGMWTGHLA